MLKNIRPNPTHYFILKIPIKKNYSKLHIIIHEILTLRHYESLQKMYCKTILVIDATLASDNPSRFRKNLLERV